MNKNLTTLLILTLFVGNAVSQESPSYEMRTIEHSNLEVINDYFASSQKMRSDLGWQLHSSTMIVDRKEVYSKTWILNLIWECKSGNCETPK